MYDIAEFDNSCDIVYALYNTLPEMKQERLKDKYNAAIELIKSKSYVPLDVNKLLLCDSTILRCVDRLHLGEIDITDKKEVFKGSVRNTTYNKQKICSTCFLRRRRSLNEDIAYSPEEKLMLYILVSTYLRRIEGKRITMYSNLTYIDLRDVHFIFGNNTPLKSNQSEKYIDIINLLIKDDIEIHVGDNYVDDNKKDYRSDSFTSWFSYIHEIRDYYGNIIGYVYSFGELGERLFSSTNYPTRYVPYKSLSINNRNYKQFEIARYLIYSATDRKKKLTIQSIMSELYDYNSNKSYLDTLYDLSNPYNIKYLKAFLKSIVMVLDNISEQFNFILCYNDEILKTSDINLYANMKDYNKLYLAISHRTN